jgi:carbamoylphosphate synthase large subunit
MTTVGGLISPDLIKAIKENKERDIHLIGVDPFGDAVGRFFVDKFYTVPFSGKDAKGFVEAVKEIVEKEKVDVIIPCGNEDNLAIAPHRNKWKAKILVNDHDDLQKAFNKAEVYQVLKDKLPELAPQYFIVNTFKDFQAAVKKLGYPQKKIVVKPCHGRGGRGVYTLSHHFNYQTVFQAKPSEEFPLEFFERTLPQEGTFEELIVMEYLQDPFYSVYSLMDKQAKTLIALTHIREWGNASQTFRGLVFLDEKLEKAVSQINKIFNLQFTSNMELATSQDGRIVLFDLNPRLGASSGIDMSIGLNFPYLALKILLDEPVKIQKDKFHQKRRFVRYFDKVWLPE